MDGVERSMMLAAYTRRKKWEADVNAAAIVNLLGKALQKPKKKPQELPAEKFLTQFGEELK